MSGLIKQAYEVAGLGKFGSNSHPVHPATVHFPLAFFTAANFLNIVYAATLYVPALVPFNNDQANIGAITILGYFINVAGIITSIPSLLTGFAELYAMIKKRGLYTTDKQSGRKTIEPVVKTALTHAGLNDVVVGGAIYHWLMERDRPHEDYRPYRHQLVLSAGALVMTLYAAYLGGSLIYTHGVGVQRMGTGEEEKKKN